MAKVSWKKAAIAGGAIWSLAMLGSGLAAAASTANGGNYAVAFVTAMGSLYPGFKPTVLGSIIGAIWGFFDMGSAAAVFVWIYNNLKIK